jgi:hypothetical protein
MSKYRTSRFPIIKQRLQQVHKQKRWKLGKILFLLTVVLSLQVFLLRSVSIENQVHSLESSDSSIHSFEHQLIDSNNQIRLPKKESYKMLYEEPLSLSDFPTWIQEYVTWHRKVRQEFPGMELFQNPRAPNILMRTCLGLCGGLHDRIGQLPWDLYLAWKTKRVLLISWQRPRSLENFFEPSGLLDWRVPTEAKFGFNDMRHVRNITRLFEGYPEDHPTSEFFETDLDRALERATSGLFSDIHVLRHLLLGHLGQKALEKRLDDVMENPQSLHQSPLFGKIFWLFFKASQPIHEKTKRIMSELKLSPNGYSAVHCRVRHPKAFGYGANVVGKNANYPADKTGLPWQGHTRQVALQIAAKALKCESLLNSDGTRVYFLADSNDLVRHVTQELTSPNSDNYNWTLPELQRLVQTSGQTTVSRDVSEETVHIDRQKGRPADAYYDTFVDLLIVMHARCVIYGIGNYAAFGAKISGTSCLYLYQKEEWGRSTENKEEAKLCPGP